MALRQGGTEMKQGVGLSARWKWEFHVRNKETNEREVFVEDVHNAIVNAGLNWFLNTTVGSSDAGGNTVYVGLKLAGAVDSASTLASHGTWTEFEEYTGDRKNYLPAAAANGQITNSSSKCTFAITSQGTVAGGFACHGADVSSKGVDAGTLISASNIASARSVDSGDTINLTITYVASNQ